jgi:hypothetical protein
MGNIPERVRRCAFGGAKRAEQRDISPAILTGRSAPGSSRNALQGVSGLGPVCLEDENARFCPE